VYESGWSTELFGDYDPEQNLTRVWMRAAVRKRMTSFGTFISTLPFDALKDQQGRYVLETHIVSYAPSGTVLNLLRMPRSSRQATMNFLGVGGVNYPSSKVVTARSNDGTASSDLFNLDAVTIPNLPGTRQEVLSLAGLMEGPNRVLLDGDATEAVFKQLPLEDFRVIHLAAHGVASTSFPDRAALLLGSSPASGEDGLLQAREIRDLPLNADLVTLAACETGNGQLLGQEGISSLEHAFLLAGAKAVIASLWTADDTFTITLMRRLYQHLRDGMDKGTALRQAKLDLLNHSVLRHFLYIEPASNWLEMAQT
jgi:CHAT domain-containing protein